jgi:thiol-disulfide isomerase/thioredoxin
MERFKALLFGLLICSTFMANAQKTSISGKITGKATEAMKEVQFIYDGKLKRMLVKKEDATFSGDLMLSEPQFVEMKSGNNPAQYYFMVPNEKIDIVIEKPNFPESIVTISNSKMQQLRKIFDSYFDALQQQGINTKSRDWQKLLFIDNTPLEKAENALKQQMKTNENFISTIPNFKKDVTLFMNTFRNYTIIDTLSLDGMEKALQEIKAVNLKKTAMNIPFLKEYLTDLTNAYAARTLDKYGITIDYLKQRHSAQFIAAETLEKYVADSSIRSAIFSEKLTVELATNGLKNEAFVNYLLKHSNQSVRDGFSERIETLQANKTPDLNAPRKRAFDFLLHDSLGKEYRLDDFKGKMVFVDFWASWCAPCKAQIPYQKELEKIYEGKDLIFLSVSLDQSKEAWLKAVKQEDLHGYILHAEGNFKNPFPKAYGVDAIPRYMLLDTEGNVITDNMIKPQNKKEIRGIIDEELYAKNTQAILDKHFEAIGAKALVDKGIEMTYRQTIPGFSSDNTVYYSFPDKFKQTIRFESTEQMLLILGEDFFEEKQVIVNGNTVTTNYSGLAEIKDNWMSRIFGFELFLRKTISNAVVKFAEENSSGGENSYVLKLMNGEALEKYYINKDTYLLEKIVYISKVKPRTGAGNMETFTSFDDYKNVNGLMIPHKINNANIITLKVENAELKQIDEKVFH